MLLSLLAFAFVPATGFQAGAPGAKVLYTPQCSRCAPPLAQLDGPNGPWGPNDEEPPPMGPFDEMLAAQRAFYDAEMLDAQSKHSYGNMGGEGLDELPEQCVISDSGESCIKTFHGAPPPVVHQHQERPIDEERMSRSPGIVRNFWEIPQEEFKKPWGQAQEAQRLAGYPTNAAPTRSPAHPFAPQPFAPQHPTIDEERQRRSPGLFNNFYSQSKAAFTKPFAPGHAAQPFTPGHAAQPTQPPDRVARLEEMNGRLEATVTEVLAREQSLLKRLAALEDELRG